jgi:hypothetical protein
MGLSCSLCEEEGQDTAHVRRLLTNHAVTMKNKYSLPHIDLIFDQLIGAHVFSKISRRLLSPLDTVSMSIW